MASKPINIRGIKTFLSHTENPFIASNYKKNYQNIKLKLSKSCLWYDAINNYYTYIYIYTNTQKWYPHKISLIFYSASKTKERVLSLSSFYLSVLKQSIKVYFSKTPSNFGRNAFWQHLIFIESKTYLMSQVLKTQSKISP